MRRRDADEQKVASEKGSTASTAETKAPEPEVPKKPDYTAEQVRKCREIISKKNYYSILGVPERAGEEEIKKAYKKLAIKFHPDKNRAPQASEAFKKVSAAYVCLTDPSKRRHYDQTGEEPGNNQS